MTHAIPNPPTNIAGYDPLRTAGDCWWDGVEAANAVDFFPKFLLLPDDTPFSKAGTPLVLQPWQRDFVATLFGWKRSDGTRRYREAELFLPRKNGKSTLAAGLVLYQFMCDGRTAGQYYSAAESRDQASLVFNLAARMVRTQPKLSKYLKVIDSTRRITFQKNGSFYRAVPNEPEQFHGPKPACVAFDELHCQRTRDTWDAVKTGMGTTVNPMMLVMSTAGWDRHSICYDVWNTARQVRDGDIPNDYILPCIYELPEGAPWDDESVWHEVNPNLGVTISLEFLREECQRAKDSPAYENTFRNLYLNQWVEQAVRWLSMDKWRKGDGKLPDLRGQSCWAAIDLSTTRDITALVLAFPQDDGTICLLCWFWVPAENARRRERMDGVPYVLWSKQGYVELTDGDSIDQGAIRAKVNELAAIYSIQEVAVDPWNGQSLMQALLGDGCNVTDHRQGFASMAGPTKEFDRLVVAEKIRHGGNPVLNWMAGNVAVEIDAAENMKPSKKKSTERIDGIVAAVMAVGRAGTAAQHQWYNATHELEIA